MPQGPAIDAALPPAAAASRLGAWLLVRPGEGRRTALLFAQLLLASAIFILGRTVRDTLFLSRYSLKALPWMFVCYGLASAVTVVIYGRYADRLARHASIGASAAVGMATYLGVWVLVRAGVEIVYPVFYVWSEVFANLFIVQFWTLANDLHDARSAKRLYATIGAARVVGVIVTGAAAGLLVRAVGTAQLLFLLVLMMAAAAAVAFALRTAPRPAAAARPRRATGRRPPSVARDPYVRLLGAMILLTFTALTLGDYQFKAIARATFREDALAQFFGLFYAAAGVLSLLFQIFVTSRLLRRLGVGWGMAVMPGFFGTASALLLLVPHLGLAAVMKFADNGLQYTIHETTLQALYVPFEPSTKARTRALLDAVVKPCAYGAGGLVLIFAAPLLPVHQLSLIATALVALWLALVPMVRRRYLRTLQATLSAGGSLALDADYVLDATARQALVHAIARGGPRQVLAALGQLDAEQLPQLGELLADLCRSQAPEIRAAALRRLAELPGAPAALPLEALGDPVPEVRAAAAHCYAALGGDDAIDELGGRLSDESRAVRVATLVGLMEHGGVEGQIRGGAELARLLAGEAAARAEAAQTLGGLGRSAYRPLVRLLRDSEPSVRRAALRACAGVADPRLGHDLVGLLSDPACRARATTALVAIGEPVIGPLLDLLADEAAPRPTRLHVPRILQNIPAEAAYLGLLGRAAADDSKLRLRIYTALSRLRAALERAPEPLGATAELVRREIADGCGNLAAWEAMRQRYQTPLLSEQAAFRYARSVERVLRILELHCERRAVRLVRHRLAEPRHRANALEVLDTLLPPALRPLVMPCLDDLPTAERLRAAGELAAPAPAVEEIVRRACRHPNPYVVLLTLDALARAADAQAEPFARASLGHPAPLVREGAILTLYACAPACAAELVGPLALDPDPVVCRHARATLGRLAGSAAVTQEHSMPSTIEKILLLRSAPIFERVAGEDLVPLARVAEPVAYAAGEVIFDEGDIGTDLYVILSGRVAISRGAERIASLGPSEAFGEMAVLDQAPRSARASAEQDSELLRIGSEEFYEILHEQVEIAEGVIRMLTRRLREATAELAAAPRSDRLTRF
ncbi:MAG: cyclic nucleotide-binding domain-containing protein [Deltaproteobacteria bacterium]|nr:cyclic nucleotide-binding domain-containing protein [Deltaproteobacteria bacterium]